MIDPPLFGIVVSDNELHGPCLLVPSLAFVTVTRSFLHHGVGYRCV